MTRFVKSPVWKHPKTSMKPLLVSFILLIAAVTFLNILVSMKITSPVPQVPSEFFQLRSNSTLQQKDPYQVIFPNANRPPYTDFAPHLNVIWSRGWYNAVSLPKGVPMSYYNDKGRTDMKTNNNILTKIFQADDVCRSEYVWVRGRDLGWFATTLLPKLQCQINLITSDAPNDVPTKLMGGHQVLSSDKIINWYAQDKASDIDKIKPIPLGIPIHYGFPGSPNSLDTVEKMTEIRQNAPIFEDRSRMIYYDKGTIGGSGRRTIERREAFKKLEKCNNIRINSEKGHALDFWKTLSSHQFGVCVTGVGWDTFRIWEMLFFGVIPIVKSSPLDLLLVPAHVPVLIVKDWSEICNLSDANYNELIDKYRGWVQNAHYWLEPSLWIPRNQTRIDQLCKDSPGCELRKR